MVDELLKNQLDRNALEVILNFKTKDNLDKNVINEIQKLKETIKKIIGILPKEHQDILEHSFFYNLSTDQIAKKFKISPQDVENIIVDGVTSIKKNITLENLELISKEAFKAAEPEFFNKKSESVNQESSFAKTFLDKSFDNNQSPKQTLENEISKQNILLSVFMVTLNIIFVCSLIIGFYIITQKFFIKQLPEAQTLLFSKDSSKSKISDTSNDNDTNIKISGSTSLLTLSRRWEDVYAIEHPEYMISIYSTDSDEGINNLIDGKTHIANSSRPLLYSDTQKAEANGIELIENRIAIDALIVIVNNENQVESLSLEDLEKIFTGKISSWKDLSGEDITITPIARERGSGTNNFVRNRILRGVDFSENIKEARSNDELIKFISQDKGAISFINSTNYPWEQDKVRFIKLKNYSNSKSYSPFLGRRLNDEIIRYGDYPLAHYLYLITTSNKSEKTEKYIQWILSKQGQKIVRDIGLVSIDESL